MNPRASRVCAAAALALLAAAPGDPAGAAGTPNADAQSATAAAAPDTPAAAPGAAGGSQPADDIRDIRGPKTVFPLARVLELAAAAAVLAAAGYAFWRWRRQRRARALKYFEIALRRLEALRGLMQPARVKEFSSAISDIVRQYIEAGFQVTATHRTTEEFLHDILETENSPLSPHRALLAEFLRQCDLAKFAGVSLSAANMESLYQSARGFVVGTSPAA